MNRESDFELQAYVDGELSPEQQAELLEAMQHNPELARQACELQNLKSQLKLAYANPPGLPQSTKSLNRPTLHNMAAGILLLTIGLFGGWLLHEQLPSSSRLVLLDPDGRGEAPAVTENGETRIVFHLTQDDPQVSAELLEEIDQMMAAYREQGRPLRVEIVSHSDGLNLVRQQLSQHKQRIAAMAEHYPNLTFVACSNTIQRLKVERGIEVKLVPQARITPSGVSHVVKRQKQGWAYIRV